MDENNTWLVCKHVMNGSAEKVQIRRDKVCFCLECANDPTIMETEDICVMDESLLMERLKRISQETEIEPSQKD
ncbi:MAG: hypothetical protein JRI93_13915 [Deltaproteobacteria bacterium]|nr:hypothetical protein [Deltaproteobacteria bacterium]